MQVDPWWDQHWVGAQNATSNIVRSAFRHIQQAHPYWNRSNGADHFLVYSYDRGTVLSYKGLLLLGAGSGAKIRLQVVYKHKRYNDHCLESMGCLLLLRGCHQGLA